MKRHILLLFVASITFVGDIIAQNSCPKTDWIERAGNLSGSKALYSSSVALDSFGNTYITGYFEGSANFGNLRLTSSSNRFDAFVAKIDTNGQYVWAKNFGGTGNVFCTSVAVDNNGHIYLTGYFDYLVQFGSETLTAVGASDIFVSKLDNNGIVQWAKQAGGPLTYTSDVAYSVAVDNQGNCCVTGTFSSSGTWGPNGAKFGDTTLYSSGNLDAFVTLLDSVGNFKWAMKLGGSTSEYGRKVAFDKQGDIYIAGEFSSPSITIGSKTLTRRGSNDIFVFKLNQAGIVMWASRTGGNLGGPQSDAVGGLALGSNGSCYLSGHFEGNTICGDTLVSSGAKDIFVTKLNSNGIFIFGKKIGDINDEQKSSLSLDENDNIYISGSYSGNIIIQGTQLSHSGNDDALVTKFDSSGNFKWATKIGSWSNEYISDLKISKGGKIHLVGTYYTGLAILDKSFGQSYTGYPSSFMASLYEESFSFAPLANKSIVCGQSAILDLVFNGITGIVFNNKYISNGYGTSRSYPVSPILDSTFIFDAFNYCQDTITRSVDIRVKPFTIEAQTSINNLQCGLATELTGIVSDDIPNLTYQWSPRQSVDSFSKKNTFAMPVASTLYSVEANTTTGCFAKDSVKVNVTPLDVSISGNKSINCGNHTELKANLSHSPIDVSYNWFPKTLTDDHQISNPKINPSTTTQYWIDVNTPNGCRTSDSITINVAPLYIKAGASETNINCGTSTTLRVDTPATDESLVFRWTPSKYLNDAKIKNPIASPGLTTNYIVQASTPNGCSASDSVLITVNNPSPPEITIISNTGDFNLCSNGLTLSLLQEFDRYEWSTGSQNPTAFINQPKSYYVVAYDKGGCATIDSVKILPPKNITTPNGTTFCPDEDDQKLQLIAPGNFNNYKWNTGELSQSITVSTPGTYAVTADKNGCIYSNSATLSLSDGKASVDFDYSQNSLQVDFRVISPSINFLSWEFGDGNTSFEQNPTHTYEKNGTYNVKVTVTDACGNSAEREKKIDISSLSSQNIEPSVINVYPNPSQILFNIEGLLGTNRITIIDFTGKSVLSKIVDSNSTSIFVGTTGLYTLIIENTANNKIFRKKIIKL